MPKRNVVLTLDQIAVRIGRAKIRAYLERDLASQVEEKPFEVVRTWRNK